MLVKESPEEPNEERASQTGNQAHQRKPFKNPFRKDENASPRKLSTSKHHHSLLYRMFHNSEDETEPTHSQSHLTLRQSACSDSSESESGSPNTPCVTPVAVSKANAAFLTLPPPLLINVNALHDSKPMTSQKSSSSLANFFKKEILKKDQKKENKFMFAHLKTNERIEAERTASNSRIIKGDISPMLSATSMGATMPPFSLPSRASTVVEYAAFDNSKRNTSELSLSDKYGWVEKKCIGKGANGVVKVSHKQDIGCEKLYAIKVTILFINLPRNSKRSTRTSLTSPSSRSLRVNSALGHPCTTKTLLRPLI